MRLPLVAAAAVVAVCAGAVVLTGAWPPGGGEPPPITLDADDRRAVDAAPVLRGTDPPPADPGVTFTDPDAVVRAYLQAAHTIDAADSGRTQLRAAPYAAPGSAAATVGVLVLDELPPGSVRTATVRGVELVAADRGDRRRGYRAVVETRTAAPQEAAVVAVLTGHVVVARQPDGRWLVAAETPENPDLPVGED